METEEAPEYVEKGGRRAACEGARTGHADEPGAPDRRRWAALAVLLLGAFTGFLDIFIVNVAAPSIQADMGAAFADIQWVPAGYTLAYATGLVTGGRLGDIFGRRRLFVSGVIAFALTSAACAAALTPGVLIGARIAQGFAAAAMLPQVLALIRTTFAREEERARAIGLYGAVIGLGVIGGQIVGGFLVQWNIAGLGWRAVLLVNLPLCALTALGARLLPRSTVPRPRTALDPTGAALLGLALFGLLHPLITGAERGWSALLVREALVATVVLGLFVLWERRTAHAGGAPLLPPRLFAQRSFSLGLPTALCFHGVNGAFVFLLTVYLQRAQGFTPLAAALEFTPMAIVTSVASMVCGRLVARCGRGVVPAGALVMAVGLLTIWAAVMVSPQALTLLPGLVLYGIGGGVVATSLIGMVLEGVIPQDAGAASGGILTAVQASEAAGVAGIGGLFTAFVASRGYDSGFSAALLVLSALSALSVLTAVLLALLHPRRSRSQGSVKRCDSP